MKIVKNPTIDYLHHDTQTQSQTPTSTPQQSQSYSSPDSYPLSYLFPYFDSPATEVLHVLQKYFVVSLYRDAFNYFLEIVSIPYPQESLEVLLDAQDAAILKQYLPRVFPAPPPLHPHSQHSEQHPDNKENPNP